MASSINLKNSGGSTLAITHSDGAQAVTVSSDELSRVKTVDTIADLKSISNTPPTVWVSGYSTKGDGAFGSNIFEWDSTSTDADNGGTIIQVTGIVTGRYKLAIKDINSDYFAQDTNGYNNAIDEAMLIDGELTINKAIPVDGTSTNREATNCLMVGNGINGGHYRKEVVKKHLPAYQPKNTIDANKHLINFGSTNTPTVVIMGDSISTEGPNAIARTNSMWSVLKSKLLKDNPEKTITFKNRAIGGQTWLNANAKPTAFPTNWYLDTNVDWLPYIEALQPDLLFLAFGMNDSNGFNQGGMLAVLTKIKAWAKVPDIIFITNPVPAQTVIYPDGTGFGFIGQTFQEGRDYVAGFVRTYADFYGHGVIDINKSLVAMRDSYDVNGGILKDISTSLTSSLNTATALLPGAIDFSFSCIANGSTWSDGRVLSVKCGLGSSDFLFVINDGGFFRLQGNTSNTINTYASKLTTEPVPIGDFSMEISIINGVASLMIFDGIDFGNARVVAEFKVIRCGGLFSPVIEWQDTSGSGPFTSINYLSSYGEPSYAQSIFDYEIWGVSDITADTKPIYGGNGINHFASQGINRLVLPTINACNLHANLAESGIHAGGRWVKNIDGTSLFSKTVDLTATIATAQGSIFVQASPEVDTDFPAIFKLNSDASYDFSTSIHVVSDSANFIWATSSGTSLLNNAIRYRLASPTSKTGIAFKVQITMIGKWK